MPENDLYVRNADRYWIEIAHDPNPVYVIHAPYGGGMIRFYEKQFYAERFCREKNVNHSMYVQLQADWLKEFLGGFNKDRDVRKATE